MPETMANARQPLAVCASASGDQLDEAQQAALA